MTKTKSHDVGAAQPARFPARRILVPVDFSPASRAALEYALKYAREIEASISVLHVAEPPPTLSGMENVPLALSEKEYTAKATMQLEKLAAEHRASGVSIEVLVRKGKAFQEITKAAKDLPADLIIIATHGYTGIKHALMGSTAERVVRHASCPVLVSR